MKNSLLLPVVLIFNLILWICVLALVTQLGTYQSLNTLMHGNFILFAGNVLYSMVYLVPIAVMLALLGGIFFLMRHKSIQLISLSLVVLFSVVSVLFLIPFSFHLQDKLDNLNVPDKSVAVNSERTLFSPGYFRNDTNFNRSIWYTKSSDNLTASPVIVINDKPRLGLPAIAVYPEGTYSSESGSLYFAKTRIVENAGGKDPLVEIMMDAPGYVRQFAGEVELVLKAFRNSWNSNPLLYLMVTGSFMLSVFVLLVLSHATHWRLINVLVVLAVFRLLFLGFSYSIDKATISSLQNVLPGGIPSLFISPLLYISFSVLFLFIAFLVFIKRKITHVRKGASYE